MDGVPAGQHCCGLGRVEEELEAHRAVLAHAVHHTHMVVLQQHQWQLVKQLHHPHDRLTGLRSGIFDTLQSTLQSTSDTLQSTEQRGVLAVSSLAEHDRASGATDMQLRSDICGQILM